MRENYPYNEALDDLTIFFKKHIKDEIFLKKMLLVLDQSRERKTVPIRGIHEEFMQYRKKNTDYFSFSNDETKMWDDLLGIWQ